MPQSPESFNIIEWIWAALLLPISWLWVGSNKVQEKVDKLQVEVAQLNVHNSYIRESLKRIEKNTVRTREDKEESG